MTEAKFFESPGLGATEINLLASIDATSGECNYLLGVKNPTPGAPRTTPESDAEFGHQANESLLLQFLRLLESAQKELHERCNKQTSTAPERT